MEKEIPSYYAVIPASVRYDKNLCSGAKLLYGEITALCNKEGFCWANNGYFGRLYNCQGRTIQRWLVELKDRGYINVELNESEEDYGTRRQIFLGEGVTKMSYPMTKMSYPHDKNVIPPMTKMSPIIIQDNNTNNICTPSPDNYDFDTFWNLYPRHAGKPKALESWRRIKPDEKLREVIFSAVKRFAKSEGWTKEQGKFIPYPATFLNQRRWEDELEIEPNPPPSDSPKLPAFTEEEARAYILAETERYDKAERERIAEARKRAEVMRMRLKHE